jgi:hypothetical protein
MLQKPITPVFEITKIQRFTQNEMSQETQEYHYNDYTAEQALEEAKRYALDTLSQPSQTNLLPIDNAYNVPLSTQHGIIPMLQ